MTSYNANLQNANLISSLQQGLNQQSAQAIYGGTPWQTTTPERVEVTVKLVPGEAKRGDGKPATLDDIAQKIRGLRALAGKTSNELAAARAKFTVYERDMQRAREDADRDLKIWEAILAECVDKGTNPTLAIIQVRGAEGAS